MCLINLKVLGMETEHSVQTERCWSGILHCVIGIGKVGQGYCQSKIN